MLTNQLNCLFLMGLGLVISGTLFMPQNALAGSRYGEAPPVVLSPDLTEPWQLQLTSRKKAKVVVRSSKSYAPVLKKKKRVYSKKKSHKRVAYRTPNQRVRSPAQRRQNLAPRFLPQIVEYNTKHKPGTLIVDTNQRYLFLVMANGEARRYGVGVGKPGFEWAGAHRVTRKAEWPSWTPPKEMIAREKAKGRILPNFMPGGIENPMGARALYLGSTLYRIHGTNAPWTIGQAVSSGCIRMRNEDVKDLYGRVPVGAKVIVI